MRYRGTFTAMALAVVTTLAIASPSAAQDEAGDRINQVIVYGDDACPPSTGDEITVCARLDESERFRIPEGLRLDPNAPANQAWAERVRSYEYVGASGTESCSPSGAGGFTGCTSNFINQAYRERAADPGIQFGRLIAEQRAARLAEIDREAAETQARVEALEAEYERRRLERESAGSEDAVSGDGSEVPPPQG